jgi:leucine-rich PPR motif-containing protein
VIVYNEIISCLAELGRVEEALHLFNQMPYKPDIFSYNTVMKGLCRDERWEDAGALIAEMVRKDCPPDEITFNTVISYLCHRGLVDCAMEVVEQMPKYGCKPDNFTYSALVNAFFEHGCVDDTLELLRTMPWKPNTVCYRSVLKGLCRADRWEDVGKLLAEMIKNQLNLDEVTFGLIIDCLCQKGLVDYGAEAWGKCQSLGAHLILSCTILLSMGFLKMGVWMMPLNYSKTCHANEMLLPITIC